MPHPPIAYFARCVIGRRGARPLPALSAALVLALGGCSSFTPPPANGVDPNLQPSNYRAAVMTFLQTNAYGMVGVTSAELSAPALRQFGSESRYVVCLNAAGPDWRKEKMFVFYGGEINQFVEASEEGCKGVPFTPFPELPTMLAQIRSKPK
jgi:hypothetical protein